MGEPRVFMLLLAPKTDADPIPGLRHILKVALRRFNLRCIDAREMTTSPERTQDHEIPIHADVLGRLLR